LSSILFSNLLALCGIALVFLVSMAILARHSLWVPRWYALASLPQGAIAFLLYLRLGRVELLALVPALLAVKGVVAPKLLTALWSTRRRPTYRLSSPFAPATTLLGAALMALVAYAMAVFVAPGDIQVALAACLTAGFLGLAGPTVRHDLWAQATALLLAEAGLSAAVMVYAGSLPWAADIAALVEAAVLAAAMGFFVAQAIRHQGHSDARLLGENARNGLGGVA
jgi:hydrogenase-4 membrane subunit HyfE